MSEITSRIVIALGLISLGIYVMNTNTADTWGAMGMYLLGWVFVIGGSWSLGLDVGRLSEGKRR